MSRNVRLTPTAEMTYASTDSATVISFCKYANVLVGTKSANAVQFFSANNFLTVEAEMTWLFMVFLGISITLIVGLFISAFVNQ